MTAPRRAIVQFLAENTNHPTAQDVFAAVNGAHPDASRATVYNTLALLVDVGAVVPLMGVGTETRYDPNLSTHHHAECPSCGHLEDVPEHAVELRLHGQRVTGPVRFASVCPRCASLALTKRGSSATEHQS